MRTRDFEFVPDKRYFSKNGEFFLVFERTSGNLVLRNEDNLVLWRAIDDENSDFLNKPGNTCFFQETGNLVIFNESHVPVWTIQPLLEVRSAACFNTENVELILKIF